MKRIRMGIIGCGAISVDHRLPALREIAEVDIAAVVDADKERARRTAEQFVVDGYFNDYRELFGRVDAVLVATPNATHCPISCDLMANGIHVLCEKPMAISTEECARMMRVRDEHRVVFMVGHTMRFYEILQQAKRFVALGWLGRARRFEMQCGGVFGWPSRSGFYFDKKQAGGGVIMDMGCHLFDTARWILDEEMRVASVSAEDRMKRGVEDEAVIQAKGESGTEIVLKLSRNRFLGNTLEVEGEKGSLSCNIYRKGLQLNAAGVRICGREGSVVVQQTRGGTSFFHEMSHFANCILNGEQPITSGESSAAVVGLVRNCYDRLERPEAGVKSSDCLADGADC